jgi:hypothetical protein
LRHTRLKSAILGLVFLGRLCLPEASALQIPEHAAPYPTNLKGHHLEVVELAPKKEM